MGPLTTELVREICSCLSKHDVKSFRLVCKAYSRIGIEYIRPTSMFMFMTDDYFGRLVTLSTHPIYDEVDYEDFIFTAHGEGCPPPPGGYLRYRTLVHGQGSIMEEDKDYQWFLSALPRFPRLRDFKLYCGHVWSVLMLTSNESKCVEFDYNDEFIDMNAGGRHFGALLRALLDAKVFLEALTVYDVPWQFFNKEDAQLHTIFQPLANLKSFNLTIDRCPNEEEDTEYRRLMRTGPLRKCLRTTTKLQSLTIHFDSFEGPYYNPLIGTRLRSAPLDQIIPLGFTWSHLTSLSLCNIDTERQELLGVLLQHKETLRELCLQDIYLRSTSWIPLLDDMRRELFLTEPRFYRSIAGHFEGSYRDGELQYCSMIHFGGPPFGVAAEDWVSEGDLCELIEMYILEGGRAYPEMKTCPLTTENCGGP